MAERNREIGPERSRQAVNVRGTSRYEVVNRKRPNYGRTGELVDHFEDRWAWVLDKQPTYESREVGHRQMVGRWIKVTQTDEDLIDRWARAVKIGSWNLLPGQSAFQSLVGYRTTKVGKK